MTWFTSLHEFLPIHPYLQSIRRTVRSVCGLLLAGHAGCRSFVCSIRIERQNIAISAHPEGEWRQRVQEAGCVDCVLKPIHSGSCLVFVSAIFHRHKFMQFPKT